MGEPVEIHNVIVQGSGASIAVMTVEEMKANAAKLSEAAKEVAKGLVNLSDASFNVGESQCQFCEASAICPAFTAKALTALSQYCPSGKVDDSMLVETYHMLPMLLKFADAVKALVEAKYKAGVLGGYGLKQVVSRRGALVWRNEAEARETLCFDFGVPLEDTSAGIISPSEAVKLIGKAAGKSEEFLSLCDAKPDSLAIVDVSDPRPCVEPPDEKGFDVL